MASFRSVLLIPLLWLVYANSYSQGFDNIIDELGLFVFNQNPNWGAGVSFYDFDKDGWSDLSFAVKGDSIKLFRNTGDGFEVFPSPLFNPGDSKQLCWVDFDNDGDADLLNTTYAGYTHLLRNDGNFEFVDVSNTAGIPQNTGALTYGASWGDYDKDGWLDLYICNYNWPSGATNWLLHNNQDGTFTEVSAALGVSNGSNPSFQSVWVDYNNDTWPDLYVINDKLPVNALYRNEGNGTFTDVSVTSNSNLSMDAMTNSVCDYDNDGDLDIYITNEPFGNALLKNNGNGNFSNVAGQVGLSVNALTWGSLWIDFDNDMWDDLFVASTHIPTNAENYFFVNNSGGFIEANWLGFDDDLANSYSVAKADYNHDGFADFVVYNVGFSLPHFYQNEGGSNHSISVGLEGTVSNRDGIGTWINAYIDGNKYVEYTMCGENYMGQDSQYEIIPMGDNLVIDSLVLQWPSGIVDTHYNIPAGVFLHLIEGYNPVPMVSSSNALGVCEGVTAELSVEPGFDGYLWSTGDTTATLTVSTPGEYYVTVFHSGGVPVTSSSIDVDALAAAVLSLNVSPVQCYGEENGMVEIIVENGAIDSVMWNHGGQNLLEESLAIGTYSFVAWDSNGCIHMDSVFISQPDSLWIDVTVTPPLCWDSNDGYASHIIYGGVPPYESDNAGANLDSLMAGEYVLQVQDSLGCIISMSFEVLAPDEISVEFDVTHSTGADGAVTANVGGGTGTLDLLWSTNSSEAEIANLSPGVYSLTITDENGCSDEFEVEVLLVDGVLESTSSLVTLFPHPATSHVFVHGLPESGVYNYSIFDARGNEVQSGQQLASNLAITGLEKLPHGRYIIRFSQNGVSVVVLPLFIE